MQLLDLMRHDFMRSLGDGWHLYISLGCYVTISRPIGRRVRPDLTASSTS